MLVHQDAPSACNAGYREVENTQILEQWLIHS